MNRLILPRSRCCVSVVSLVAAGCGEKVAAPKAEAGTGPVPTGWNRTWTPTISKWIIPNSFPW